MKEMTPETTGPDETSNAATSIDLTEVHDSSRESTHLGILHNPEDKNHEFWEQIKSDIAACLDDAELYGISDCSINTTTLTDTEKIVAMLFSELRAKMGENWKESYTLTLSIEQDAITIKLKQ